MLLFSCLPLLVVGRLSLLRGLKDLRNQPETLEAAGQTPATGSSFWSDPQTRVQLASGPLILAAFRFLRPHTIKGTLSAITGLVTSFFIHQYGSPQVGTISFSWMFTHILVGTLSLLCANGFIVGVNQIYDVEIDKINKPFLPLANQQMTPKTALFLVSAMLLTGLALVFSWFPRFILGLYALGLFIGLVYSIPGGLKTHPLAAASAIVFCRCFLLNLGVCLALPYVLGMATTPREAFETWPPKVWAHLAFVCVITVVISIMKDIPDVKGDYEHAIPTLALFLGTRRTTQLCGLLMGLNYLSGICLASGAPSIFARPWWYLLTQAGGLCLLAKDFLQCHQLGYTKLNVVCLYTTVWNLLYFSYFALIWA